MHGKGKSIRIWVFLNGEKKKYFYLYIGPRQAEVKKKEVAKILKSTGIHITIKANL